MQGHQQEQHVTLQPSAANNHFFFVSNDEHRKYGDDFDIRTHACNVLIYYIYYIKKIYKLKNNRKQEIPLSSTTFTEKNTTLNLLSLQIITFSAPTTNIENTVMTLMSDLMPLTMKREISGSSREHTETLSPSDLKLTQITIYSLLMMEPTNTVMIMMSEPMLLS